MVFVGGSRGTSPSLDLTFSPTGLSENLGGMERGRGGKGEREGWGIPPALLPPTGFCLKYHPEGDYHPADAPAEVGSLSLPLLYKKEISCEWSCVE